MIDKQRGYTGTGQQVAHILQAASQFGRFDIYLGIT
jgi:hypothetical protein